MSGDVDFGDYADVACCGIGDEVAYLVLCVVLLSLCKFGMGGYLYAESLVVGEVQLQDVELETCHFIDIAFDGRYGQEMSCGIEHECPVSVTWRVLYFHCRYADAVPCGGGICKHPLVKCVDGIEDGVWGCAADGNALVGDGEGVLFLACCQAGVYAQCDVCLGAV